MFIAHVRKKDGKRQLLKDHLKESARLSEDFGRKIGLGKTCYLTGLIHDLGKYSNAFQQYLVKAVANSASVKRGSIDHSTAGGKLIYDICHKENKDPVSLILAELIGNAISVLCMVTQPSLEHVGLKLLKDVDGEMITNLIEVESSFKRVEIMDKTKVETRSLEDLANFGQNRLKEKKSLLIILNTKSAVRKLYQYFTKELLIDVTVYHLSTSMCGRHRKIILDEVRKKLENKERILCITTQLIEAGVDISFQSVIRSIVGNWVDVGNFYENTTNSV